MSKQKRHRSVLNVVHRFVSSKGTSPTNSIARSEVIKLIASLEVKSLPSDDPELQYWQGFADAQLKITELVETA